MLGGLVKIPKTFSRGGGWNKNVLAGKMFKNSLTRRGWGHQLGTKEHYNNDNTRLLMKFESELKMF